MPLIKSKSPEAFKHNVEAEIHAGKPQRQAVAIAYAEKNAAKKAKGGLAKQAVTAIHMKEEGIKPKHMADGGHPGLYANIHAKQQRIAREKAEGRPVEHMRKPGSKGAPTKESFVESAKTAKKKSGGSMKKSGGCSW